MQRKGERKGCWCVALRKRVAFLRPGKEEEEEGFEM